MKIALRYSPIIVCVKHWRLTWLKLCSSSSSSVVGITTQGSSEENNFISMFSLKASSTVFFSPSFMLPQIWPNSDLSVVSELLLCFFWAVLTVPQGCWCPSFLSVFSFIHQTVPALLPFLLFLLLLLLLLPTRQTNHWCSPLSCSRPSKHLSSHYLKVSSIRVLSSNWLKIILSCLWLVPSTVVRLVWMLWLAENWFKDTKQLNFRV